MLAITTVIETMGTMLSASAYAHARRRGGGGEQRGTAGMVATGGDGWLMVD